MYALTFEDRYSISFEKIISRLADKSSKGSDLRFISCKRGSSFKKSSDRAETLRTAPLTLRYALTTSGASKLARGLNLKLPAGPTTALTELNSLA